MVCIAPTGFLKNNSKIEKEFYNLVTSTAQNIEIINNGFKQNKTNVQTAIFTLSKDNNPKKGNKNFSNGYSSYASYLFFLQLNNEYKLHEKFNNLLKESTIKNFVDDEVYTNFFKECLEYFKSEDVYFPYFFDEYLQDLKNIYLNDIIANNTTYKQLQFSF